MNCDILIITNKSDYTADFLIKQLHEREIQFFRLNTEDFPIKYSTSISLANDNFSIELKSANKNIDINQIKGIWYRRPQKPHFSKLGLSDYDEEFATRESSEFLLNLWNVLLDKRWVSNPNSLRIAERKAYQLQKAIKSGFDVPITSFSNDPEHVLNLYNKLDKHVIVKPISHGDFSNGKAAIFTIDLSDCSSIPDFEQASLSPFIIQEKVDKISDIRTVAIGHNIFSFEITKDGSTIVDWRTIIPSRLEYKVIITPKLIQERILSFMNDLNISFGAFDFAYTKTKEWIFLEVNPNGQWAWLEQITGIKISETLINFLISGE